MLLSGDEHHVSLQGIISAVGGAAAVFDLLGHGENGAAVINAAIHVVTAVLTSAKPVVR